MLLKMNYIKQKYPQQPKTNPSPFPLLFVIPVTRECDIVLSLFEGLSGFGNI